MSEDKYGKGKGGRKAERKGQRRGAIDKITKVSENSVVTTDQPLPLDIPRPTHPHTIFFFGNTSLTWTEHSRVKSQ